MDDSEAAHQRALILWARRYDCFRLLFAIPNGGARDRRTGAVLQGQGVVAGMPDLCLPVPRRPWAACYIELKRPASATKGRGRVSEEQSTLHTELREVGNVVAVAYGWPEAAAVLERYLVGRCAPDGSVAPAETPLQGP